MTQLWSDLYSDGKVRDHTWAAYSPVLVTAGRNYVFVKLTALFRHRGLVPARNPAIFDVMTAIAQAAFNTKHEVGFSHSVLPALDRLNVRAEGLRHGVEAGELHVTLILPDRDPSLRATVFRIIDEFEESYAFAISVSPALLYWDDPALSAATD